MNQELKQRLIGAVVVTALAAIFIPMLFDDPIDQGGQSVTELEIPSAPITTGEISANKLPSNSKEVLASQEPSPETTLSVAEESELSTETIPPAEANIKEEPDNTSTSLDTGMINEQNQVITSKNTQPAVVKPTPAPVEQPTSIEQPKKPTPAPPKTPVKITTPPVTNPVSNESAITNTPKVKSEFSRWTLQAGSFSKKENATALMETLKKQGLPVTLDTVNGANNSVIYRLKVGPTLDKKRANDMKAKLDNLKIQSLMISE